MNPETKKAIREALEPYNPGYKLSLSGTVEQRCDIWRERFLDLNEKMRSLLDKNDAEQGDWLSATPPQSIEEIRTRNYTGRVFVVNQLNLRRLQIDLEYLLNIGTQKIDVSADIKLSDEATPETFDDGAGNDQPARGSETLLRGAISDAEIEDIRRRARLEFTGAVREDEIMRLCDAAQGPRLPSREEFRKWADNYPWIQLAPDSAQNEIYDYLTGAKGDHSEKS